MQSVTTIKTRLLLAKAEREIPADCYLVLRKVEELYQIVVVEQSGDTSDPAVLASFIDPTDVDAGEALHAACIALEKPRSTRKVNRTPDALEGHSEAVLKTQEQKETRD